MNKQKFVKFIKEPKGITADNIEELEEALIHHPYFQSARLLLAKASKIKNTSDQKEKIARAAVYANDRQLLKRYLTDDLIFLRTPKAIESEHSSVVKHPTRIVGSEEKQDAKKETVQEVSQEEEESPYTRSISDEDLTSYGEAPSQSELDHLIEDLWNDVAELRKNKARFFEIEKKIEEDEAFDEAVKRATKKAGETKSPTTPDTSISKEKSEGKGEVSKKKKKIPVNPVLLKKK